MVPVPPWAKAVAEIPPSNNRIARLKTPKRTNVLAGIFIFSTPPIFRLPGRPFTPYFCSQPVGSDWYIRPTHYRVPIYTFCYRDLKIRSRVAPLIHTEAAELPVNILIFSKMHRV